MTAEGVLPRDDREPTGLNGMTLRGRLRAVFLVALALLLVALAISAFSFARLLDGRRTLFNQIDPARLASEQLLIAMLNQETGVRGYVLTGQASFLQPFVQGLPAQRAASAQLDDLLSGLPGLLASAREAEQRGAAWQSGFAKPAVIATAAGNRAYASDIALQHSKVLFDRFRAARQRLNNALASTGQEAAARLNDSTMQLAIVLISAAALAVVAGLVGQRSLRVWVTDPLLSIGGDARQVADGDLGHAITSTGPPEFRRLAGDSEAMRLRIVGELDEIERARAELVSRNAELARSNAELEQFAYVASHDMQEPLRKVTSFCQLLQQRYQAQLDDRGNQYIEFAVDGAKRMQGLINDLLAFSRVGRTTDHFVSVDLGTCVAAAVKSLSAAIEESGAVVTAERVTGGDGRQRTDHQRLPERDRQRHQIPLRRGTRDPGRGCPGWPVVALFGYRQRDRHRAPLRRAGVRHLSTPALPRDVRGDRDRFGPLPEDRRVPRRQHLARYRPISWHSYLVHSACHPRSANAMNVIDETTPIEVLLVEDDPGDVLMTREALAGSKLVHHLHVVDNGELAIDFLMNQGAVPERPPARPRPLGPQPAPARRPRGPGPDQVRPVASPDSRRRPDHLRCRGRRAPQLRPPRQRLRDQAGRIRGVHRRRAPDRRVLPLDRPPPQALTPVAIGPPMSPSAPRAFWPARAGVPRRW